MKDTITELTELTNKLPIANEMIGNKSRVWAEKDRAYRIALAQTELVYKADKYPATLIHDLARGKDNVANLKFEVDIAEGDYWTAIREYDALQKAITILDRQVQREWSSER